MRKKCPQTHEMSQDDVFFTQNQSFKCSFRKGGEVSLLGLIVVDSLIIEPFLASLVGRQCSI